MYHIILAGGTGSRFWPKSRKNTPKQLLSILSDQSMIRLTFNRINKISKPEYIFIVAPKELAKKIQKEIPELPKMNFVIEPSGKNTAPAIGLAAIHIIKRDSNAIIGIYPSDHLIIGDDKFNNIINKAKKIVTKESALVAIGIKPNYPSTGYGYIKYDPSVNIDVKHAYKIKAFIEKPDNKTATKFLETREYLWNIGIFVWKAETILSEIKILIPKLYKSLKAINDCLTIDKYDETLNHEWGLIEPESIDYGILEKTKNVFAIEADFKWDDIGSWKSLFNTLTKNKDDNYYEGNVISLKSKNNLILSPNRLTAVIGIENMSIINLEDATLIVPHEQSESVKDLVNMLISLNKTEYL